MLQVIPPWCTIMISIFSSLQYFSIIFTILNIFLFKDLVEKINSLGHNAIYISDFDEIVKFVKENAKPEDIVLTLGAGTVTNIGSMLVD